MKDNNLLASAALFSELYNNEKYTSVTDIIGEFIKSVVVSENKWTVNSTELTHLLHKLYDFRIPESVVKMTVRNRLKHVMTIQQNGYYFFDSKIKEDFTTFNNEFNSIIASQNIIIDELIKFVEKQENTIFSEVDKSTLIENLNNYLLNNRSNEKYSKYISVFVIKNQNNHAFTNTLNLIREGIILYQGIKYTADLNELGKWNTELTIFLSMEHLFNAVGFNGILFKQIFDDFYRLVNEINLSNKDKNGNGGKLIQLKYFEETRDEVSDFFQSAEYILKGKNPRDTTKPAMIAILEGCKNPSDIVAKKTKFESDLKLMGIALKEINESLYKYQDYVVEDEKILNELKEDSLSKGREFDEKRCRQFFRIFTKINYLRGGKSNSNFERIGNIFITANRFALHLTHQSKVKFEEDDIPFAKDIDYLTNKFWFKLKKGFSNKSELPKSFDVVTKAQIILSSQLNQTVSQEYDKLQKRVEDGSLSRQDAIELSYELREKPSKPEEITFEIIDSSLDFLNNESYFEDFLREKEMKDMVFQQTLKQNEELQNEIKRREEIERQQQLDLLTKQREIEKEDYAIENWKSFVNQQKENSIYCLWVGLLTGLPIIIGFILKGNKALNEWMDSLENWQYWSVWAVLTLIFLAEVFGRSYIFNKEKVKSGWLWLNALVFKQKFQDIKEMKFTDFYNDFEE